MTTITTVEQLGNLYGKPGQSALVKELGVIIPEYAAFIEASPFVALGTVGDEGLDCSPRGDVPGFVRIEDERTLLMPDRRGNNRIDSLRNIVRDGRVALLFLIPGSGTTLRVNGRATIETDAALLASFTVQEAAPRSVIRTTVDAVYFQCARAIHRSNLWKPEHWGEIDHLPTPGQILEATSRRDINGAAYDAEWPDRAAKSMW